MMRALLPLVALCVLGTACARTGSGSAAGEIQPDRSAVVVRGSELAGNLLDGLAGRVTGMRVVRHSGACPGIIFRGQRSAIQQGNPSVYIDDTMMTDTCILGHLTAGDIDFVEIYTSGSAGKPGGQRNPFGSIYVYRVRH